MTKGFFFFFFSVRLLQAHTINAHSAKERERERNEEKTTVNKEGSKKRKAEEGGMGGGGGGGNSILSITGHQRSNFLKIGNVVMSCALIIFVRSCVCMCLCACVRACRQKTET